MSWDTLEPIVAGSSEPIRQLVRRLARTRDTRNRRRLLRHLNRSLGDSRYSFLQSLVASSNSTAQQLALEMTIRYKSIESNAIRRLLQPLLASRELPTHLRVTAAAALIRGAERDEVESILLTILKNSRRWRSLSHFELLAGQLGPHPVLDAFREQLYGRQRLQCPRCGVQRRRNRMAAHLWNHHQLLLDGHKARPPAQILDEFLLQPNANVALGEFHRTLLARGLKDEEALAQLQQAAAASGESLCPMCHANVPDANPPALMPAELSAHRLSTGDVVVNADSRISVSVQDRIQFEETISMSPWPSALRWLSFLSGAAAIIAAIVMPTPWHWLSTLALLGEGFVLLACARRIEVAESAGEDELVDAAWEHLTVAAPMNEALARIALISVDRGDAQARAGVLALTIASAEAAVRAKTALPNVLPPLWILHARDGEVQGRDPLPELTNRLSGSFRGDLPLSAAAGLLQKLKDDGMSRADRARLRVLTCEQAFEAGLGVWDIVEIARAFPSLAYAVVVEDLDGLARLRLVWDHQRDRPWMNCGPAATAFELARYPVLGGTELAESPDLLLFQPLPPAGPGDGPEPIIMTGRGLLFRGILVRTPPKTVRVEELESWRGGGFVLRLDSHRLRFYSDPSELANILQRWAEFFLGDFVLRVDAAMRYRGSEHLSQLLDTCVVQCPGCQRPVIPVIGSLAIPR